MAPLFAHFEAEPPAGLRDIYTSFRNTDAYLDVVLELRPRVLSFQLGLPRPDQIEALRGAGLILIGSATSPVEARSVEASGFHAVVAQGWEAGGHRGTSIPQAPMRGSRQATCCKPSCRT